MNNKKPFIEPRINRVDLQDQEVSSMAVAAKGPKPDTGNPCAVGGIGEALGGTPLPKGFGS